MTKNSLYEWLDRPINCAKEDTLHRCSFSDTLATSIAAWEGNDSLIIGLHGPWGCGKTSVKNMVLEQLRKENDNKLIVIEFNPWRVINFDQLSNIFFTEIKNAIPGKLHKLRQIFTEYCKQLDSATINVGLPGANVAINAKQKQQTIEACRTELFTELSKKSYKFLVIIDDIDRLAKEKMALFFQLIKANADFPNFTYLLLFQKDIVTKALETDYDDGSAFLEKIIQLEFDVPHIKKQQIELLLNTGLRHTITDFYWDKYFKDISWQYTYWPEVMSYFKSLRDVKRFLLSFQFTNRTFSKNKYITAHPEDLVSLEVLRIFEHRLYHQLPSLKHLLINHLNEREITEYRKELHKVIDDLSNNKKTAETILRYLFPNAEWIFSGVQQSTDTNKLLHEHRVASADFFDNYFTLTSPDDTVSTEDILHLIEGSGDKLKLREMFDSFGHQGKIYTLLQQLATHSKDISIANAIPIISVLCDIIDLVPQDEEPFILSSINYAWRTIYFYLLQEQNIETRGKILEQCFRDSTGVSLPILIIMLNDPRTRNTTSTLVTDSCQSKLKKIVIRKISQKNDTELIQLPYLGTALTKWHEWATNGKARSWILRQIQTRDGFFKILSSFATTIYSSSIPHTRLGMSNAFLSTFDIKTDMASVAEQYPNLELTYKERDLLAVFNKALNSTSSDVVELNKSELE